MKPNWGWNRSAKQERQMPWLKTDPRPPITLLHQAQTILMGPTEARRRRVSS